MDIELFFAVLKRFKKTVIGGLVLAIGLAALAHMHHTVIWESNAEALITETGFPYGQGAVPVPKGGTAVATNPGALSGDAPIYVQFVNGDAVQSKLKNLPGTVVAGEVTDPSDGADLPFIALTATGPTAEDAVNLAQKAFTVLTAYITQQQTAAGIPPSERAILQLVGNGSAPKLAGGSSSTIPILVFVAVFGAAIAIAFLVENARPKTAAALGRVPVPNGDVVSLEPVSRFKGAPGTPHPLRKESEATTGSPNRSLRRDAMAHRADDGASKALLDRLIKGGSDSSVSG
jgi:hypothetical protein